MTAAGRTTGARPQIALAGNPNVGKTTLFNALTGSSAKVSNYPGITVERRTRRARRCRPARADLHDLPGTYSLNARSAEEQIAFDALAGLHGETAPDAVIVVPRCHAARALGVSAAAVPRARRALRRRADDGRRGRRRGARCRGARRAARLRGRRRSPRARGTGLAELRRRGRSRAAHRARARRGRGRRRRRCARTSTRCAPRCPRRGARRRGYGVRPVAGRRRARAVGADLHRAAHRQRRRRRARRRAARRCAPRSTRARGIGTRPRRRGRARALDVARSRDRPSSCTKRAGSLAHRADRSRPAPPRRSASPCSSA